MDGNKRLCGMLRRRECWLPTWRGLLALALAGAISGLFIFYRLHPFLAVTDPMPGGVLVVEGWAPDYAFEAAMEEFQHQRYEKLCVTGGPLEAGAVLSQFKTYAERGAAVLVGMGLSTNQVQAVPAEFVRQDRTYVSALYLRKWLQTQGLSAAKVHLITQGPHARRSRLLFEQALGPGYPVGVTAIPARDYDPARWWRYSSGVRAVIGETFAYLYARLFFQPHE
jgi:uncharacterized SAM-binding protein YcdF (DUF218 family)